MWKRRGGFRPQLRTAGFTSELQPWARSSGPDPGPQALRSGVGAQDVRDGADCLLAIPLAIKARKQRPLDGVSLQKPNEHWRRSPRGLAISARAIGISFGAHICPGRNAPGRERAYAARPRPGGVAQLSFPRCCPAPPRYFCTGPITRLAHEECNDS